MTKHDIAKFIVRIFGIYLFFLATTALTNMAIYISSIFINADNDVPIVTQYLSVAPSVIILFFYLVFAILLWIKTDFFAKIFIGVSGESDDKLVIEGGDLEPIAYSIIGVYLLVTSIPNIVGLAASKFLFFGAPSEPVTSFIAPVIKLFFGIMLLFNSGGFPVLIKRLRTAGLHRDKGESD